MCSAIGQGWSEASICDSDNPLLLEAISKFVPPALIDKALTDTGHHSRRVRKLPATVVIWLVLLIGLRSDLDVPAMWRQLVGTLLSFLLRLVGRRPPSKSAFCTARQRVGPRPLRQLFLSTALPIAIDRTRGAYYKGMRLMAMDGQDYKVPDTPENAGAFGRPSTRRKDKKLPAGYPQIHVTRMIEVGTRMCVEALVKPSDASDHHTAGKLLQRASPGDLVLWDKGYYSFQRIAQAIGEHKFFLAPVPSHVVLDPIEKLPDGSFLAKVYPSPNHRRDDREGIVVRVVEYTFDDPDRTGHQQRHRLITNLLDAEKFPAMELIVLYHERWEIEINNDEITTHQLNRPVELRSRKPAGVVQELYGVLIAHNAVHAAMHEAALAIDVDPRTLSFMSAVRLIRDAIPVMRNAPTERLPAIYCGLILAIAQGLLPPRDNRINPRVVKVLRPSNFPAKRPEHCHAPQPHKPFKESIRILPK
jgi:hypothetical protein